MQEVIEWIPIDPMTEGSRMPDKNGRYNIITKTGAQKFVHLDLGCSKCVMTWLREYKYWSHELKGP